MADSDSDSDISSASGMSLSDISDSDSDASGSSDSDRSLMAALLDDASETSSLGLLPFRRMPAPMINRVDLMQFFIHDPAEGPPAQEKDHYHSVPRNKCTTLAQLRGQYTEQTFINEFRFAYGQMVHLCEELKVEEFIQIPG